MAALGCSACSQSKMNRPSPHTGEGASDRCGYSGDLLKYLLSFGLYKYTAFKLCWHFQLAPLHVGSGKTLAYLLPVMARIIADSQLPPEERFQDVHCLVVVPSQELAMQIVRQVERVLGKALQSSTSQLDLSCFYRWQTDANQRIPQKVCNDCPAGGARAW